MSPLLPEIVAAVVARVRSAKQPNLIAALLSIFARLVHADCNALVALLAGMPAPPLPPGIEPTDADTGADGIPPPTSALELVARAWTGFQPDVQGAFDIKLTTSALALLLSSGNPAVGAVVVRGPPVVDASASGTIRTRAKARAAGPEKFQPAPLPSKILDLLADAVLEAQEAEAGGDDDDDEWEEDEDGDDEGYGGGGGGGGLGGVFGGDLLERLLAKGVDDAVEDGADERRIQSLPSTSTRSSKNDWGRCTPRARSRPSRGGSVSADNRRSRTSCDDDSRASGESTRDDFYCHSGFTRDADERVSFIWRGRARRRVLARVSPGFSRR